MSVSSTLGRPPIIGCHRRSAIPGIVEHSFIAVNHVLSNFRFFLLKLDQKKKSWNERKKSFSLTIVISRFAFDA